MRGGVIDDVLQQYANLSSCGCEAVSVCLSAGKGPYSKCMDLTLVCPHAHSTKSSIVWMRFLNFLCPFITSPKAYRNWHAKCLHSSRRDPNGSNWTGGSPIRSRLRGLGMFAFLGLVKIMHVIRRKWLLSLPVGNSVHGTTALCLIKDRPERAVLRK